MVCTGFLARTSEPDDQPWGAACIAADSVRSERSAGSAHKTCTSGSKLAENRRRPATACSPTSRSHRRVNRVARNVLADAEEQLRATHLVCLLSNVGRGFWQKIFGSGGDSVLRAGYGIYYDHFGENIVNLFTSTALSDCPTPSRSDERPDARHVSALHRHSCIPNLTGTPQQTISYPALLPSIR